jgi:hypothetical protein
MWLRARRLLRVLRDRVGEWRRQKLRTDSRAPEHSKVLIPPTLLIWARQFATIL